jgi:hypothetical protein
MVEHSLDTLSSQSVDRLIIASYMRQFQLLPARVRGRQESSAGDAAAGDRRRGSSRTSSARRWTWTLSERTRELRLLENLKSDNYNFGF